MAIGRKHSNMCPHVKLYVPRSGSNLENITGTIESNTPKESQNDEELPFSPVQRKPNNERGDDNDRDGSKKLTVRDPFK